MKVVVSGFPGVGKSTITKNAAEYGLKVCGVQFNPHTQEYERIVPKCVGTSLYDVDGTEFQRGEFPTNYIKFIKEILNTHDNGVVLFISSDEVVREGLQEAGIEYQLVYPKADLKEEYIERLKAQGSTEAFVEMMNTKWDTFIESVQKDPTQVRFVLESGQNLADVIGDQIKALTTSNTPDSVQGSEDLDPSRAELVAAHYEMENDAIILEDVVAKIKSEDEVPAELLDESETMMAAAADIKERYDVDMAPTLAGMESFLGSLKESMGKLLGKSKVERKERIKNIYDLRKELDNLIPTDKSVYAEGEVAVTVPKSLVGNEPLKKSEGVVKEANESVASPYKKQVDNVRARLIAGLKIYNKYAKHPVIEMSEVTALLSKEFPIKPAEVTVEYIGNKEDQTVLVKLPALDAAGINKAVGILKDALTCFIKMEEQAEVLSSNALDFAEMAQSPFWDGIWEADEVEAVADAIYYQRVTNPLYDIIWNWETKVLPVIKFLESWIIKSVK